MPICQVKFPLVRPDFTGKGSAGLCTPYTQKLFPLFRRCPAAGLPALLAQSEAESPKNLNLMLDIAEGGKYSLWHLPASTVTPRITDLKFEGFKHSRRRNPTALQRTKLR
jgi:hypothetical protein